MTEPTPTALTPPQAPAERTVHREHGLERPDDYHWLKTEGRAGHGGSSGRFDALREKAEAYAFLLEVAGVGSEQEG